MKFLTYLVVFLFNTKLLAKEIHYSNLNPYQEGGVHSVSISYDFDEPLYISGHAILGMDYFESDNWASIDSPHLIFSINKSWKNVPDNWEFKGNKFKNYGKSKFSILGNELVLYKVHSEKNKGTIYYSFEKGIVAFIGDDGVYILDKNIGLFSTNTKKESQEKLEKREKPKD